MQNVWNIALRQFRSYFNGPVAYIVTIIILGAVNFLFWKYFFLQGRATIHEMFNYMGTAMLFAAPALTMGLVAEEKSSGTIELLLTMPVREWEVVVGKFLGAFGLYLVILLFTLVDPIAVSWFGEIDPGPVATGYLGLILEGAAMIAIGLVASSTQSNQLVAFFISLFVLAIVGWLIPAAAAGLETGWVASALQGISFTHHLENMARGVIDTRDVLFFVSLTIAGLTLSFQAIEARRWN
ncbi:MAG: ABC transporter permease subunit [Myxococcales bacterium]|nr:ABC transporter permease subunit [Myxococcales bacterium]